jgi:ubiquitin fusion degradation protein 1
MQLTRNGEERLPSPLVFELRTEHACTHVGVWEFSAEEGTCEVPDWMMFNLRVTRGSRCSLRLVSLPECSFVRLQPFSRKFLKVHGNDRDKVLASLQVSMQRFAALTVGDVIQVREKKKMSCVRYIAKKKGDA